MFSEGGTGTAGPGHKEKLEGGWGVRVGRWTQKMDNNNNSSYRTRFSNMS